MFQEMLAHVLGLLFPHIGIWLNSLVDLDARLNAPYQAMRNPGFAPLKSEENMTPMVFP